ncbi:MAG: DNA polymerase III subunit delta [bacterium]
MKKKDSYSVKVEAQHLTKVYDFLTEENFLPVYFLFGADTFALEKTVDDVIKSIEPFVASDFDKEVLRLDKKQEIGAVISSASTYPFGDGKKLIVIKSFENVADKKILNEYISNPSPFTILVITHNDKISSLASDPYKTMALEGWMFEARELKGLELINWVIREAKLKQTSISNDDAAALIEIVGEDKNLLEQELIKFYNFLGSDKKITFDLIKNLASNTREFTIFNLLDAIGVGNKEKALITGYNLLHNGTHILMMLSTLNKYFITIVHSKELIKKDLQPKEAALKADVSEYFYKSCLKASFFRSEYKVNKAIKALLNADLSVKTTNLDPKTIFTLFIAEIFG